MTKPQYYPLDRVVYGTRSDGVPVVLVRVPAELSDESGLPVMSPAEASPTNEAPGWQLLANVTLTVLDGPGIGFLLAAPAMARTAEGVARSGVWTERVLANGGAIALLIDHGCQVDNDDLDQVTGRGGFVRATPKAERA